MLLPAKGRGDRDRKVLKKCKQKNPSDMPWRAVIPKINAMKMNQ